MMNVIHSSENYYAAEYASFEHVDEFLEGFDALLDLPVVVH